MKKVFKKLHLWLSVPFGLIITIICFSGASLVFESEINELNNPQRSFVSQVGQKPLPVEQLLQGVSATLPDSVSVSGVTIPSDPRRTYQVNLSKPRRASVFVDPYTGQVIEHYKRGAFFTFMFRAHRWLLDSMKPGGGVFVGKLVVGISTLLFVIILITGIIIWIPRSWKAFRNSMKISVRKGWKRFWYSLHVAGGMYAVIILLALALTGLTWSFSWYRNGFYKVFGASVQQSQPHGTPTPQGQGQPAQGQSPQRQTSKVEGQADKVERQVPNPEGRSGERAREDGAPAGEQRRGNNTERAAGSEEAGSRPSNDKGQRASSAKADENEERSGRGSRSEEPSKPGGAQQRAQTGGPAPVAATAPFAHWQQVYDELNGRNPGNRQIALSNGTASISYKRWGNQRASDRYTFDRATGDITGASLYRDQERAGKLRGWIYSVHVGNWGGLFSKIITFLAALLGGTLPLTGYYLWIKRGINKRNMRKRQQGQAVA